MHKINNTKNDNKPVAGQKAGNGPAAKNFSAGKNRGGGSVYAERRKQARGGPGDRGGRTRGGERSDEFEQRVIDIARVTRVMAGGKRMRFRACVAVGNKKGKIAFGLSKGADVTMAVTKAVNQAKKDIVDVPIVNETIPHEIYCKYGAAKIILKPARKGKGVIAGGAARIVLELAGVRNITSKILGTNNKVNITRCTVEALKNLKNAEPKKSGGKESGERAEDGKKEAGANGSAAAK